jgi:CRP-like cAMP-binding protein
MLGEIDPAASALFERSLLFRALNDDARADLSARAFIVDYSAGEPIFHLGDAGTTMMTVVVGRVRIVLPTQSGKEIILADLGPGELFGEVALLDGGERSAAARAQTSCRLVVLERRDVLPFLLARPPAMLALVELLCARLRRADERMTDMVHSQLPTRLAKTIIGRTTGRRDEKLSFSQSELAAMVGVRRESVNRQLRAWHRAGLVELRDGWIVVHRRDALAALSGCA